MKAKVVSLLLVFILVAGAVSGTAKRKKSKRHSLPSGIGVVVPLPDVVVRDGKLVSVAPDVFDCVVTEIKQGIATVKCDTRNRNPKAACAADSDPLCVHFVLDVPLSSWASFSQWTEPPATGQLLKGQWNAENRFQTVASCTERKEQIERAVQVSGSASNPSGHRQLGMYKRDPLNLKGSDSQSDKQFPDCNRPQSQFIKELLASTNGR